MTRRNIDHRLPVLLERRYSAPPTRGHCIAGTETTGSFTERAYGRRCQAAECKHHLGIKRSEDVPGRRYDGVAPEWTVAALSANAPSCALDVAARGEHSAAQVAEYMGFDDKRRAEQIIQAFKRSMGAVDVVAVAGDGVDE